MLTGARGCPVSERPFGRKVKGKDAGPARLRSVPISTEGVSTPRWPRTERSGTKIEAAEVSELFPIIVPYPHPVNGAELLRDIVSTMRRFVVADEVTLHAAALWVLHSWLMDVVTVSPIANITAPTKGCGKTVLLTVVGKLVYRPLQVANIASAAIFRAIARWTPTLLIDEVDTFLRENEAARGILNSGLTRDSAYVVRCVGEQHTPTRFSTWGAKALCGIGRLHDTLADRSVTLRLRRKGATERTENVRHADPLLWEELKSRIARWVDDNREVIRLSRSLPIEGLGDRANDCWEPLLAIADVAGEEWPNHARNAALSLSGVDADTPGISVRLLADIRCVMGNRKVIFTAGLLRALVVIPGAPWQCFNHGREISARQLSDQLAEFGIRPATVRDGAATAKGYTAEQFRDAFSRYLQPLPPE